MQFKKATREAIKLKLGVSGLSGSGKTMGSLLIARGLVGPQGKIAVIDTEQGKSALYADHQVTGHIEYDVLSIDAPFTTHKYIQAIDLAIKANYDVIIIDSITHEWDGQGGIKDQKDAIDARGGNQFTNWGKVTPLHDKFVNTILTAPIHIISTMRSKSDVVMEQNDKGKQAPKKVGLKAVQRDGLEYEFDLIFDMAHNKTFSVTKDRTGLFDNRIEMLSEKVGEELKAWLSTGKEIVREAPKPFVAPIEPNAGEASGPTISIDQQIEIGDLLRDSGVDRTRFYDAYQIKNIGQLQVAQYDIAKEQLMKRMAQNQTKAQGLN